MSENSKKGLYLTFLIVIPLVCLAYLVPIHYYQAVTPEIERLQRCREDAIREVNKGETLKARSVEFEEEIERLQAEIRRERVAIPEKLDCEGFIHQLRELSSLHQLDVTYSACEAMYLMEGVPTGEFIMELRDPSPKLEEFLNGVQNTNRLTQITSEKTGVYNVSIFAMEPLKAIRKQHNCSPEGPSMYWPFKKRVEELREDLRQKQRRITDLQPFIAKVHVLEDMREELVKLKHLSADVQEE